MGTTGYMINVTNMSFLGFMKQVFFINGQYAGEMTDD
jgi:hypothetical protein